MKSNLQVSSLTASHLVTHSTHLCMHNMKIYAYSPKSILVPQCGICYRRLVRFVLTRTGAKPEPVNLYPKHQSSGSVVSVRVFDREATAQTQSVLDPRV